jgi:small-conductance mechanosensitive channel
VRASLICAVLLLAGSVSRAESPTASGSVSAAAPSAQPPSQVIGPPLAPPDASSAPAAIDSAALRATDPPAASADTPPPEPAPPEPATSAALPSVPAASLSAPTLAAPPASAATPAPSASAGKPAKAGAVRLGETTVFTLRGARGSQSAGDRARFAEGKLLAAVKDERSKDVRVVREADTAVVYAGPVPIITLVAEDAALAGDLSLDVYAGSVAAEVRKALEAERERSRIEHKVFAVSVGVLFALIALFLVKKLGEFADRGRDWLDTHGDRMLAIRVQRIELVRPATLRSAALILLGLTKLLGQFGILFAWLVFVLSQFESTRHYTSELTAFLVQPFSALVSRVAAAVPLIVFGATTALVVFVLVRFIGLFLASVSRGEATLSWLPADLAGPVSVLVRVGIVISALIFAAPIVTGGTDGAFARAGLIALVAIGLSSTPLLATGIVGTVMVFGRRLRVGEHVQLGARVGRIAALDLFDFRLETQDHTEIRVPHLVLLREPLTRLGLRPRLFVDLTVSATASPTAVVRLLEEAGANVGRDVSVELSTVDGNGIRYRVGATCDSLDARSELAKNLLEALAAAAVSLGRGSVPPGSP